MFLLYGSTVDGWAAVYFYFIFQNFGLKVYHIFVPFTAAVCIAVTGKAALKNFWLLIFREHI